LLQTKKAPLMNDAGKFPVRIQSMRKKETINWLYDGFDEIDGYVARQIKRFIKTNEY
jgi:hypothetical protein